MKDRYKHSNMAFNTKALPVLIFISITLTTCQQICEKCDCSKDTPVSVINCASKNIMFQFNDTALWNDADNKTIDVRSLNFQNNNLVRVYPFPKLNVTVLDLSRNRISKIDPKAFKFLQNMAELDLTDNQLASDGLNLIMFEGMYAPEDDAPLRSLKTLRLSHNLLHTLDKDLFQHMDHIENLYLNSNPFKVIDKSTVVSLSDLPYLKVLDLSSTQITTLPDYMLHTPKYLQALNLSNNLIVTLPETLSVVHNLEWLSISSNPIENLGDTNSFPQINTLKVLHVCDMGKLKTIQKGAFSRLSGLSEIYIANNDHLESIDADAFSSLPKGNGSDKSWPPLKIIDLSGNNLTRIDTNLVNWTTLDSINIRFNPWTCDCDNQWMISDLIPIIRNKTKDLLLNVTCGHPKEFFNHTLSGLADIPGKQLRCLDKNGNLWPESDSAILVGIVIGILLTIPIMFGILFICQRNNYYGLLGARGPAEYSRTFYKRADNADEI